MARLTRKEFLEALDLCFPAESGGTHRASLTSWTLASFQDVVDLFRDTPLPSPVLISAAMLAATCMAFAGTGGTETDPEEVLFKALRLSIKVFRGTLETLSTVPLDSEEDRARCLKSLKTKGGIQ